MVEKIQDQARPPIPIRRGGSLSPEQVEKEAYTFFDAYTAGTQTLPVALLGESNEVILHQAELTYQDLPNAEVLTVQGEEAASESPKPQRWRITYSFPKNPEEALGKEIETPSEETETLLPDVPPFPTERSRRTPAAECWRTHLGLATLRRFSPNPDQDWPDMQTEWKFISLVFSPGGMQNHAGLTPTGKDVFGNNPHSAYRLRNQRTGAEMVMGPTDVRTWFGPWRIEEIQSLEQRKEKELEGYATSVHHLVTVSALAGLSEEDLAALRGLQMRNQLGDRHFAGIQAREEQAKQEFSQTTGFEYDSFFDQVQVLQEVNRLAAGKRLAFLSPVQSQALQRELGHIRAGEPLSGEGVQALV